MKLEFPKTVRLSSGEDLTIDFADPSDAAEIVAYLNQVGGESDFLTFGRDEFWISVDGERDFIQSIRQSDNSLILKGVVGGKIAAVLTLMGNSRPRLRHGVEMGISVLSRYWGRQIGRLMSEQSILWAKAVGIREINLRVREDNQRAIKMYQQLGFQLEGTSPRSYSVNGKFFGDNFMGLSLD